MLQDGFCETNYPHPGNLYLEVGKESAVIASSFLLARTVFSGTIAVIFVLAKRSNLYPMTKDQGYYKQRNQAITSIDKEQLP